MISEADIRELQPYTPAEYRAGMDRLLAHPVLAKLVSTYFPGVPFDRFAAMARALPDVPAFQAKIIAPAIDAMLKQCSGGMTLSGLERIRQGGRYLYIANHRDIILDPSLLTQALCVRGYGTPKICLGDNLLSGQLVIDLIKMNKGATVKRGLSPRELLRWSHVLSELIRRTIHDDEDSVWIAQREGRTKDGDDRTQPGVLKMLAMAGEGSLPERLKRLSCVPVAVSYELDPCDLFKARATYLLAERGSYSKAPGEDHKSMLESIEGQKGRIHFALGSPLQRECDEAAALEGKKEQVAALCEAVDRQIHALYRLWPTNYAAVDLLEGGHHYAAHYTPAEREGFAARLEKRLDSLEPELASGAHREGIRRRLLEAYAKPVSNQQKGSAVTG